MKKFKIKMKSHSQMMASLGLIPPNRLSAQNKIVSMTPPSTAICRMLIAIRISKMAGATPNSPDNNA